MNSGQNVGMIRYRLVAKWPKDIIGMNLHRPTNDSIQFKEKGSLIMGHGVEYVVLQRQAIVHMDKLLPP